MRPVLVSAAWRAQARAAALVATTTPTTSGMAALGLVHGLQSLARRWSFRARRVRLLPDALERIATALRSGSSLLQALDDAATSCQAPLNRELRQLVHEADTGRALQHVLDDWVTRHDDPGTRLAACALAVAAAAGAAPARALDGVAATLRDRLDLAGERRALATQARASALVLSATPVAFAALLTMSERTASRFLLGTPTGWACLTVGLALDAVGAVCMWRMTRGPQ